MTNRPNDLHPVVLHPMRLARAAAGLGGALLLLSIWFFVPIQWPLADRCAHLAWCCLTTAFGLEIRIRGQPDRAKGMLYVANHVSWADIVVLARVLEAGFVAKPEVAGWQVIGRGAKRLGCQFVVREQRGVVHA
ncbi:MAG: 1-acyl-sn-glycerol-3-phosphate acyltransferase [Sphingomonadales bacterium]|nr:1-acyl-sn-glycerol-3-phosphate acyltransferase [Sphingomonadales bacterium]